MDNIDDLHILPPGQPCHIYRDMAELVRAEFSIQARIERARREHRALRHLLRAHRLAKAEELAA